MRPEDEVRQRREALALAVNQHDLEAVRSFLHPSFVARAKGGQTADHDEMVRLAERLLAPGGDYEVQVEIQGIAVSGGTARVTVARSHATTGWLRIKHRGLTRAVETWSRVDGRWLLVEEQEL
jgi:hypothetical protein